MPEMRVFSTAGLPAARRIELWEGHNTAALIGLSCHTAVPGALEATEVNVQLGRIQLARVTGSPHVVERTAEVIRRSPADAVAVYVTLRGDAWFRHEDGRRDLRPGQVLICDATIGRKTRKERCWPCLTSMTDLPRPHCRPDAWKPTS